ncbi:MAG: glycosyltransferase family 1 protein [Patescibacteria group bacterium]|nr:glycosyltransferase family 1 protein [Patescibacteria group bacterium]
MARYSEKRAESRKAGKPESRKVIGIDASRANSITRTGTEWYAYHLIRELKSLIPDSCQVVLYSKEPLRDDLVDLPAHWENRVLRWPPRYLWTQMRLAWEMLVRPPDLLFVPAHTLPLVLPKKAVTTLHDVTFMVVPEAYSWKGRAYHRFAARYAVRRAAHIFTVSEFSRQEIMKWFGADAERISVTHLSYDESSFRSDLDMSRTSAVLNRHGVSKPYFLFVGRLERKKNFAALVEGFRKFRESHSDHNLVLVGKRGRGADEVLGDGIEGIREMGYVGADELPHLYAGAEAFVFPSRHEGFGIPVLESFACGTPVITSRNSAIPEVAGQAAYYLETNDAVGIAEAMGRIIDQSWLREKLSELGSLRVRDFTWRATAEKTWEGIERLL